MKRWQYLKRKGRSGTTLVEMVVTMLLSGMMMAMIAGIMSPAAKMFVRIQKQQFAQLIMDNTISQLQAITRQAVGYVKVYAPAASETENPVADKEGSDRGGILEFMNTQGYVALVSADSCPETTLYLGTTKIGTVAAEDIKAGTLLTRYYTTSDSIQKKYVYENVEGAVARAAAKVFADGYYMGNYLEIEFSFPDGIDNGQDVGYLNAELSFYELEKEDETGVLSRRLVLKDSTVLDFRYKVQRKDEVTAVKEIGEDG